MPGPWSRTVTTRPSTATSTVPPGGLHFLRVVDEVADGTFDERSLGPDRGRFRHSDGDRDRGNETPRTRDRRVDDIA